METADALKDRLAALPDDVQRALLDDLRFRLERRRRDSRQGRRDGYSAAEIETWDALVAELTIVGAHTPPMDKFVGAYGVAEFRDVSRLIHEFVASACGETLSRAQRLGVLRVVLRCLIENAVDCGLPATATTVLHRVSLLAFAVDECFPGYTAARLLHRVAPVFGQRVA